MSQSPPAIRSSGGRVSSSSKAAGEAASSNLSDGFASVETTNFNAVKVLIAKYGLNIDLSLSSEKAQELGDLGEGTPIVITSQKFEGGRTVWRITKRFPDASELKSTHHSSSSASTLSSTSNFEDRDGNPLQGGDVLGAVLGTHPCFPSVQADAERDIGSNEFSVGESPDTLPDASRQISPFGLSVEFYPFTAEEWKEISLPSHGDAAESFRSLADGEQPHVFDYLQVTVEDADEAKRSQGSSQPREMTSSPRPRALANHPRFAVWATHVRSKDKKAIAQTPGPWEPFAKEKSAASTERSCHCASTEVSPLVPKGTNQADAAAFPGLRPYQISGLFPGSQSSLLAATLPRLIVQLTSGIDSRLQIDFFYTFRAFVSAQNLLQLLTERFDWTMRVHSSCKTVEERSVVRVRTYVVIKFWLTHFFEEDFLPDHSLRDQVTDWLNAFGDLRGLDGGAAGPIASLRKTVLRLKQLYSRSGVSGLLQSPRTDDQAQDQGGMSSSSSAGSLSGSEVDLKLPPDAIQYGAERVVFDMTAGATYSTKSNDSSLNMQKVQQANHPTLSSISRALNSTMHKLHRLTRTPQQRDELAQKVHPNRAAPDDEASDLLFAKGGIETFLEYFHLPTSSKESSERSATSSSASRGLLTPGGESVASSSRQSTPATSIEIARTSQERPADDFKSDRGTAPQVTLRVQDVAPNEHLHHTTSEQTLRSPTRKLQLATSISNDSMRSLTEEEPARRAESTAIPGIVQIDDIDLSSDEDDDAVRRALRRLPGARDLRHARKTLGSVRSSSGDVDEDFGSVAPRESNATGGSEDDAKEATRLIGIVHTELFDPDEALAGYELVKGFNLDGFESDDDEPGDAEAALRKLEGYIDEEKKKDRERRVEALWQKSRGDQGISNQAEKRSHASAQDRARQTTFGVPDSTTKSAIKERSQSMIAKPGAEHRSSSKPRAESDSRPHSKVDPPRRGAWVMPPVHHSFLLECKSDEVASQMCLIEAELFTQISWQELASGRWRTFRQTSEISDWEEFYRLRMRARALADSSSSPRTEAHISVIVARFNLAANWVASEILLTMDKHLRIAVITKFIRVAWKCYQMRNFASVAQIVFGLQSPWVERLHRTWAGVPAWAMRILRDLRALCSPAKNFRHMRNVMDIMISEEGMEELVNSAGPPDVFALSSSAQPAASSISTKGCIPFCGLFLMDLMENDVMPAWLTPEEVTRDGSVPTLSPLLQTADGPLVNVLKFRVLAMILKTVIAFQQRARSYNLTAEGALYLRCLKLRCLPSSVMTQLSQMAES